MFNFYTVGGSVRDELLGIDSKDIDFVAVALYPEGDVGALFKNLCQFLLMEGYEIFLTTPECYTVRARFPRNHVNAGLVADFVLARKEIGYVEGTRTPIVVPGTLHDDLSRRDFTINAIARDLNGTLIDPFDGQRDLKVRVLRTPISGEITFEADPLRLIRAIRFSVTRSMAISPAIDTILREFDYSKMEVVSEERIREELIRAFKMDTWATLGLLEKYKNLKNYIFLNTNIWLKPTQAEK